MNTRLLGSTTMMEMEDIRYSNPMRMSQRSMTWAPGLPITERSNPITRNIDTDNAVGMVQRLHQCDQEIFEGWQQYPVHNIYSSNHLKTMSAVAQIAASLLKNTVLNAIVIGGSGTSGRLAFLTSRSFNTLSDSLGMGRCYDYTIAGGDRSLIASHDCLDSAEDSAQDGADTLEQITWGKSRVLYIGLTCGLSSPWVAGQLDHCLKNLDKYIPVLVGFNPVRYTSDTLVEGWTKSLLEVVTTLEGITGDGRGFILNPVVGPEAIAGSSRMKGGTASKILLDTILLRAHYIKANQSSLDVSEMVRCYESLCKLTYQKPADIARLGEECARSLKSGGHVYYVGAGTLGIMGMIDAAECPTTFCTDPASIRCFIVNGWKALRNRDGDLSSKGPLFQISYYDFKDNQLPKLSANDFVIILSKDGEVRGVDDILASPSKVAMLNMMSEHAEQIKLRVLARLCCCVQVRVHDLKLQTTNGTVLEKFFIERQEDVICKLVCNAATTIGHILLAKVYKNYMISFKVSNVKLFTRAQRLIKALSLCSDEDARTYLQQAIYYGSDDLEISEAPVSVSSHIQEAKNKDNVVPLALILALTRCSLQDAEEKLKNAVSVQAAVKECLESKRFIDTSQRNVVRLNEISTAVVS